MSRLSNYVQNLLPVNIFLLMIEIAQTALIFVEPACDERDMAGYNFNSAYVRACVRNGPGHNVYIYMYA